MNCKKGFTLVELLAVMIVLVLIVIMAYNIIKKNVDDTIDNSVRANAGVYIKGASSLINEKSINDASYDQGVFTVAELDQEGLKISGTKPDDGYVVVYKSDVVLSCLVYEGYYIVYSNGTVGNPIKGDCSSASYEFNFNYTGSSQEFTAPYNGSYKVELWGAQGGSTTNASGGKGAYVSGIIKLNKNDKLYVYVGQKGSQKLAADATGEITGGYNGGATGNKSRTDCSQESASGGGATDVRLVSGDWNNAASLKSRIMVSAGGGGSFQEYCATTDNSVVSGGAGGALTGYAGTYIGGFAGFSSLNPTGATQTSGGQSLDDWNSSTYTSTYAGQFGIGATGSQSYGGGGGGYWGGASGKWQPGAGGSSFISGYTGSVAIISDNSTSPKTGCANGTTDNSCSIHYSTKVFTEGVMIDGNSEMPTHDGLSTTMGNTDDGYARITYVGS